MKKKKKEKKRKMMYIFNIKILFFYSFYGFCYYADSGRRFGNQSRRSWQTPEHDGLLGSGSFPRPSGYAAGASAPKVRANDHYQLNRSNEPYHPPRPYKVNFVLIFNFLPMLTLADINFIMSVFLVL